MLPSCCCLPTFPLRNMGTIPHTSPCHHPPSGTILEILHPWRQMDLHKPSRLWRVGDPGGNQATATRLGERDLISALTQRAFAQGLRAEGLFMNSGKYSFWKIHTSKENTLIHPLNTLAVLALLHVWTLLLARAALWFLHAASRKNLHFEQSSVPRAKAGEDKDKGTTEGMHSVSGRQPRALYCEVAFTGITYLLWHLMPYRA